MKVRYKNTGKIEHVPNNVTTDMLLKAGLLEVVVEPPPAPGTATWNLINPDKDGLSAQSQLTIVGQCAVCNQKLWGAPASNMAAVDKMIFWHCGRGEHVPKDVAAEYVNRGGGTAFPTGREMPQPEQKRNPAN
jgi:hypothetical protein